MPKPQGRYSTLHDKPDPDCCEHSGVRLGASGDRPYEHGADEPNVRRAFTGRSPEQVRTIFRLAESIKSAATPSAPRWTSAHRKSTQIRKAKPTNRLWDTLWPVLYITAGIGAFVALGIGIVVTYETARLVLPWADRIVTRFTN